MSAEDQRTTRASIPAALTSNERIVFVESIVAIIVVWAVVSHVFDMTRAISSPALVASNLYQLLVSLEWVEHVVATFQRTMYGFVVTVLVGSVLGVAMGWSKFWEASFKDYITVGLALPSLFAAVFAAMWFGISDITPTVAAAAISFPFVTQGIYQGVKDIDSELLDMSNAFNLSRSRFIRRVVVQSIMPEWFAGARYAFAICWKITTLAELIIGNVGIGYMISTEMNRLSLTGVITWTLLFLLIILIAEYAVFQQIEKRVFAWRQEESIAWA